VDKKLRPITIAVIALFLLNLALAAGVVKLHAGYNGVKYTLYIGLNDKDSYTQLIPTEDAMEKVSAIALKHADGFTLYQAQGAYLDDAGVETFENSLVLVFFDAEEAAIRAIMDEVIAELNQSSILVEREKVRYEFYEGAEK